LVGTGVVGCGMLALWGERLLPGSQANGAFLGPPMILVGLLLLWTAAAARLSIAPDGLLLVRSFPPWPATRVRLDALASVRSEHRMEQRGGTAEREDSLVLRDHHGAAARVVMQQWPRGADLRAAVNAWAASSRAQVDPGTRGYLETGRPRALEAPLGWRRPG
jgi:hypothetical protein